VENGADREQDNQTIGGRVQRSERIPPLILVDTGFVFDALVPRSRDGDALENRHENGGNRPRDDDDQIDLRNDSEDFRDEDSEIEQDDRGFCKTECHLVRNLGDEEPLLLLFRVRIQGRCRKGKLFLYAP
jgi:hypothetical protein